MARVLGSELVGAREGSAAKRKPRIASERSDIDHLCAALEHLAALIRSDVAMANLSLARAVYAAQTARYRAQDNRTARDKRKAER